MAESAGQQTQDAVRTHRDGDAVVIELQRDLMEITTDLASKDRLFAALHQAERNAEARIVLLAGDERTLGAAGYARFVERLFDAAGAAAASAARSDMDREQLLSREEYGLCQFIGRIARCPKITVAALAGELAAPYLGMALAFDYRLVAATTVFQLSCAGTPVPPGCGLGFFLPRYVGHGRAMELVLRGRPLVAAEAEALGLVNAVLPADDFVRRCRAHVAQALQIPPEIVGATKSMLLPFADEELPRYLERECEVVRSAWRRHEVQAHSAPHS